MKTKFAVLCTLAAGITLAPVQGNAAAISVSNWGFEDSKIAAPLGYNDISSGWSMPGWTATGVHGGDFRTVYTDNLFLDPYEGLNVAYVGGATLSQTLAATALANTHYVVSLAVGRGFNANGNDFTVQLLAGGTPIIDYAGNTTEWTVGSWKYLTFAGLSGDVAGQQLQLVLSGGDGYRADGQVLFDSVSAATAPEPSSLVLGLAGAALIGIFGARRRKTTI